MISMSTPVHTSLSALLLDPLCKDCLTVQYNTLVTTVLILPLNVPQTGLATPPPDTDTASVARAAHSHCLCLSLAGSNPHDLCTLLSCRTISLHLSVVPLPISLVHFPVLLLLVLA